MVLPLINNQIRTDGQKGGVSNSFGKVRNNGTRVHQGWDLLAQPNSAIFSVGNGIVVQIHQNVSGYGKCILIETYNPKYNKNSNKSGDISAIEKVYVLYAHLSVVEVKQNDKVSAGQQIAKSGQTGNAGGEPPHLHIEVLLQPKIAKGTARIDPGNILGFELYSCGPGSSIVNQEIFGSASKIP
jgi:murein DD-endopeptidase MepM/ murein hydrolase activator NlpD